MFLIKYDNTFLLNYTALVVHGSKKMHPFVAFLLICRNIYKPQCSPGHHSIIRVQITVSLYTYVQGASM